MPGVEQAKRGRGNGPRITDLLKPGQEIVVQVVKDPLKTKGARLSMELTIAGRYMVFAPTGEGVGVSRRLEDKERDRLRKEAKQLDLGGGGAIIRTAAHGATRADFERELQYLFKLNEVLEKRVKETAAPALVFQEADLSVRVVRDIFSEHFERAIVDDERAAPPARLLLHAHGAGARRPRRALRRGRGRPLFEAYGVDPVINGMLERRVDLPSGGYLIIDYAEALTVIDVNTGSFTGKGKSARLEDTITKTNLEAAEEAVRQLRLRDIGGIIVIDFIDMARSRNREAVLKVLRKALDEDRTKTFVVEISPLGLVEMTRQNVTDGVREIMTKACPVCSGEGVVKSEETIAIEFSRHLRHMVKDAGEDGPEAYLLRINPKVTAWFIADGARELHALEAETGRYFHFEGSDGLRLDHFAVTMEGTRARHRGARRPVPRGRRSARAPRRAAHVQRGRRGGQGRRLPDRRRQRRPLRRREEDGPHRGGRAHDRHGRARGRGRRRRRRGRAGARRRAREGTRRRSPLRRRQARRGQPPPARGGRGGRRDRDPDRRVRRSRRAPPRRPRTTPTARRASAAVAADEAVGAGEAPRLRATPPVRTTTRRAAVQPPAKKARPTRTRRAVGVAALPWLRTTRRTPRAARTAPRTRTHRAVAEVVAAVAAAPRCRGRGRRDGRRRAPPRTARPTRRAAPWAWPRCRG